LAAGRLQSQPQANGVFHGSPFVLAETTQFAKQLDSGSGGKVLGSERSRGRRKPTVVDTSKREPRVLVVCGSSVASARSASPLETFQIRPGRVLAAMPRSTNHTLPRDGLGGSGRLALVELHKEFFGSTDQLRVGQRWDVARYGAAKDFADQLPLVAIG